MKTLKLHSWDVTTSQARDIQSRLSSLIITEDRFRGIQSVCGLDVGFSGGKAQAACVVMSYPDLEILDFSFSENPVSFPYIPGYLSFREIPALVPSLEKLKAEPDLVLVDGQGVAHPRRFGLASHVGIVLDKPAIGCAKSKLTGAYEEPGLHKGDVAFLYDGEEKIGAVLRTRSQARPLFVSVGHKISLNSACPFVLNCCTRYRLPEPIRYAHLCAKYGSIDHIKKFN
jgi:deoxyribonuclease V